MTPSEAARLALYNRLGEVVGFENADTLMSSLPAQPIVNLATNDDIDRLDQRMDRLEGKVDALAAEMRAGFNEFHKALRHHMVATIGAMTALTGIFSLVVGLIT